MNGNDYYFDPFAKNNQQTQEQNTEQPYAQPGSAGNQFNQPPYANQTNQPVYGYGYGSAPVIGMDDMAEINKAKQQKREIKHLGTLCGGGVLLFTIFSTILSLIIVSTNSTEVYNNNFFFQNGFYIISSVVAVGFGFYCVSRSTRKTVDTFLPAKSMPIVDIVMYVIIGLALCRVANSISTIFVSVVSAFGFELNQGEMLSSTNFPQLLFEIVAVAVVPGIIEEYAMRGTVLQPLKKYGPKFAIFATACVFGFMHGNLIQAPFALMVGIVLAYITIKTESIIPAMLIHFANNANSVVTNYMINNVNEDTASRYFAISLVVVMILAVGCFVYLVVKNSKRQDTKRVLFSEPRIYKSRYELTEWQKFKAFISAPAMIIAIILMILNTAQTITYTGMRGI